MIPFLVSLALSYSTDCNTLKSVFQTSGCCKDIESHVDVTCDVPSFESIHLGNKVLNSDSIMTSPKHLDQDMKTTIRKSRVAMNHVFTGGSGFKNTGTFHNDAPLSYASGMPLHNQQYASVIKKDDTLYAVAPAHGNYAKAMRSPLTDYTYKNFEPQFDMDFGTTDLLLWNKGGESTQAMLKKTPLGVGVGSDVWGFVDTTYVSPGLMRNTYFSLQTTSKGMVIYKMLGDYDYMEGSHIGHPVQYIESLVQNQWGDVKTYDVTTMTLKVKGYETLFKRGSILKLDLDHRKYGTDDQTDIKASIPVEILSSSVSSMGNGHSKITLRLKTEFSFEAGDHGHMIHVGDYMGGATKMVHYTVENTKRDIAAYLVKETEGDRLLAIDLRPLLSGGDATVKDMKRTYDTTGDWEVKPNTTTATKIGAQGGAHNVYVNEEQGALYTLATRGTFTNNKEEEIPNLMFDILSNPYEPVLTGALKGYLQAHDVVTTSYDAEEQEKILGIPSSATTPLRFITLASVESKYQVWDTTDPGNLVLHGELKIKGDGYYHQAWFTTDKKYVVLSDELQPDHPDYLNRVPLLRLYWDPVKSNVGLVHVQDMVFSYPALVHNQYIASNRDPFAVNEEWEDWVVGSNYIAGMNAYSIKYDNRKTLSHYSSKAEFETRENPFLVKELGFLKTTNPGAHHSLDTGWSWSVVPFWRIGVPARKLKYAMSDKTSSTIFRFKEGVQQLNSPDMANDGRVLKAHPKIPTVITSTGNKKAVTGDEVVDENPSRYLQGAIFSELTINRKDGKNEKVTIAPLGVNHVLDMQVYVIYPKDDVSDYYSLPLGSSVVDFENVYSMSGNHIVSGSVVKAVATDYYRVPSGDAVDIVGYSQYYGSIGRDGGYSSVPYQPINVGSYASRVGEMITTLTARQGDSGNPIVNEHGHFVGFVNSLDIAGGKVGGVSVNTISNFINKDNLELAKSNYNGIAGVVNNRNEGITEDDPKKILAVAINPRTGRFYGSVSYVTSAQYFMVNGLESGFTPDERGNVMELFGGSAKPVSLVLPDGLYQSLCWAGLSGNILPQVRTFKVAVLKGHEDKLLFAEELGGFAQNRGPRMLFLGENKKYSQTESNSTHIFKNVYMYPVSESSRNASALFSADPAINKVGGRRSGYRERESAIGIHPAYVGDYMESMESKVGVSLIEETDVDVFLPSWNEKVSENAKGGCLPFNAIQITTSPAYTRSAEASLNVADYQVNGMEILATGSSAPELVGSSLRLPLDGTMLYEDREVAKLAEGYSLSSGEWAFTSYAGRGIISIDGVDVSSDTLQPMLESMAYEEGKVVKIGLSGGEKIDRTLVPSRPNSRGYV